MTHQERRERRQAMVHMLKAGRTVREVAKMFRVTEALVYLARRGERMPPRKINPRLQVISDLSAKGMRQSEIALVIGVSRARVSQLVNDVVAAGLPMRRRQAAETVERQCGCGKTFNAPVGNTARMATKKFCSRQCSVKYRTYRCGGPSSCKEMVTLTCENCGQAFERSHRLMYITRKTYEYKGLKQPKRHYCSQACYLNHRYGGER